LRDRAIGFTDQGAHGQSPAEKFGKGRSLQGLAQSP
jgi:hypothetical protein